MSDWNRTGEDIEARLRAFIPPVWNSDLIRSYIGDSRFELDLRAINENAAKPIEDFVMRGGKRLRPRLLLALAEVFKLDYEQCLHFAYFVELIHNATLVLDDIEDNAELRRGKSSMHKGFGIDTAVNAGMLMHVLPLALLIQNTLSLTKNQEVRVWRVYGEELLNVGFGQAIDIHWHKTFPEDLTRERYLEMCRLKTGSLMRMSLRIPCALAETDAATEKRYLRFAESLGIAFQIQDDILDLTADKNAFGKGFGNDITEGKQSLPVILAYAVLPDTDRKRLRGLLMKHTIDAEEIAEAIALVKKSNSIEAAGKEARKLLDDAWLSLGEMEGQSKATEAFRELAEMFIRRAY